MRLEINYKEEMCRKYNTNTWKQNNTLLNKQWITTEIKEEIKKYPDTNENETTMIQMGCSKRSSRKEVYSNIILRHKKNLK